MNKTIVMYVLLIAVVFGGILYVRQITDRTQVATVEDSGEYVEFAQCIADSGAKFYGAFWCPHCKDQKEMFGSAEKLLPYIECSTPNKQGQTSACLSAGIESYPSWDMPDGSRVAGTQTFEDLSAATGCALPS